MIYLWILLGLLGAVALVVGLLVLVLTTLGKKIPVEHTATSFIQIAASPERVFEAIADIEAYPTWDKATTRVHLLPGKGEMQQARVHRGHNSFVLMRTRCDPPKLLERTIADDRKAFNGTWLYRVSAAASPAINREACEVKLTETGRVNNAAARAVMKHVFGYHMYTNKHLESLARKFGTEARAHRA
jgi:uncharacterized protein YndB with AHSA1/START domain